MMEEKEDKCTSFLTFLAGAGIGALIGAATALLLAPQSGSESRDDVKETARRLMDRTEQLAGRVKETTGGFISEKREVLSRAAKAFREGAEEKKQELDGGDAQV